MQTLRYKIIDLLSAFSIRWGGRWKKANGKIKWVKRSWANDLENYTWWLKWQHTLKYHGDQNFGGNIYGRKVNRAKILNIIYGKHRKLFKIFIGLCKTK